MKMTWSPVILSGLMASVAIVLFTSFVPQLLGLGSIDIAKELGMAFNPQAPYMAGTIFLVLLSIAWSAIFTTTYDSIPGNSLMKGVFFGIIVGLFSLTAMPNLMTVVDSLMGGANEYTATPFAMSPQVITTILTYLVFGITLAWAARPKETITDA